MLLLELMLKTGKPFGIFMFDHGWTREQKKVVDAIVVHHNLQTYSYPAVENLLVTESGEVSLVSAYAIDCFGNTAAIIRDIVDEPERCVFDAVLPKPQMLVAPTEFDTHIWGTRSDDRHWIFGELPLSRGNSWQVGEKVFLAPLWDWTREEVSQQLEEFGEIDGYESEKVSDLHYCTNCLTEERPFCPKADKEIEPHKWDSERNLQIIREWLVRYE